MERILITGAGGEIGKSLRQGLRGKYPIIRLNARSEIEAPGDGEEVVLADLTDMAALDKATEGVDAIVHMAAQAVEAKWERVLNANIIGCFNLYEAARRNGVKRIVFGSSHHAVGFYRRDRRIDDIVPPRPDCRYGVSKVFGEALARLYADKHGIAGVCLRIGTFRPKPTEVRMLNSWVSPRDMTHLVERSLEAPDVHFEIVYGVSANDRNMWDNPGGDRIGYAPQDNAEDYAEEVLARMSPEDEPEIERLFHGAIYCGPEFDGDPMKID